jgi:hypothetical protein
MEKFCWDEVVELIIDVVHVGIGADLDVLPV